jgi:hypothetical protein
VAVTEGEFDMLDVIVPPNEDAVLDIDAPLDVLEPEEIDEVTLEPLLETPTEETELLLEETDGDRLKVPLEELGRSPIELLLEESGEDALEPVLDEADEKTELLEEGLAADKLELLLDDTEEETIELLVLKLLELDPLDPLEILEELPGIDEVDEVLELPTTDEVVEGGPEEIMLVAVEVNEAVLVVDAELEVNVVGAEDAPV